MKRFVRSSNLNGNKANEEDKAKKSAAYGDVIGVQRIGYKHYGIYLDPMHVIHYAPVSREKNAVSCIIETDLAYFLNGADSYFICKFPPSYGKPDRIDIPIEDDPEAVNVWNNLVWLFKRNNYNVYSSEETVARAKSRLGECRYNLILNNCEHFAVWCKTGISESHQVNSIMNLLPIEIINE